MKKYLVFIERRPHFSGNSIPKHREYLNSLRDQQSLDLAGGFTDQTGGAYVLRADSLEDAINIVKNDPMYIENECTYHVKEWNV